MCMSLVWPRRTSTRSPGLPRVGTAPARPASSQPALALASAARACSCWRSPRRHGVHVARAVAAEARAHVLVLVAARACPPRGHSPRASRDVTARARPCQRSPGLFMPAQPRAAMEYARCRRPCKSTSTGTPCSPRRGATRPRRHQHHERKTHPRCRDAEAGDLVDVASAGGLDCGLSTSDESRQHIFTYVLAEMYKCTQPICARATDTRALRTPRLALRTEPSISLA